MIAIIDNYDSFVYNLYQYVGEVNPNLQVFRNDALSAAELAELNPQAIILSPGPGRPSEAGNCIEFVRELSPRIPMLGVCLGHQAICEAFGAQVGYAMELRHGKQSVATLDIESPLFEGLPTNTTVARYHSLAVNPETLPACLKPIAFTADGEVMAVQHVEYPLYGVQFHPESIMTPEGKNIIRNFLELRPMSS